MERLLLDSPFGTRSAPTSSQTRVEGSDALKEHLAVKAEEILKGTLGLAQDLNKRSYMDRAVGWLPGALLSKQGNIVSTSENLRSMPAVLAEISESMDNVLRCLEVSVPSTHAVLQDIPEEPRAPRRQPREGFDYSAGSRVHEETPQHTKNNKN